MAGVSLEYDDAPVLAALGSLLSRIEEPRAVFDEIREYLLLAHDDRWRAQQAPDGTPWVPLSDRYAKRKRRNPDKILQLEGNLRNLSSDATSEGLVIGTNRIYGATHQFGRPGAGIPARPFLGISGDERLEILEIIREHYRDAVGP